MSGLLGALLGQLTGAEQGSAEGTHSALQDTLGLNQPGGIAALVEQFTSNGMAEHVQSWIGNGSNLPITAEQVQQVLSNDQVKALVQRTGLSTDTLLPLVAKLLPHAVDQATPGGAPPST
jgi:uncharacterized protein YidB (DUF937 family)